MKITDRFIGDHKTFKKLIGDLDKLPAQVVAPEDARRLVRLVELFVDHLLLHAWGEETFFYPRVAQVTQNGGEEQHRLEREHGEVDALARRMEEEARKSGGGDWRSAYDGFKKELLGHMTMEETDLFPRSESLLGAAELENISRELERRRSEAPRIRRHQPF
jgi:hemerythrin-like domain-containing protein